MARLKLEKRVGSKHLPHLSTIMFRNTCRLLNSKFSPAEPADAPLARLSSDLDTLTEIFAAEERTDDLLKAENDRLPGISPHELVVNVRARMSSMLPLRIPARMSHDLIQMTAAPGMPPRMSQRHKRK